MYAQAEPGSHDNFRDMQASIGSINDAAVDHFDRLMTMRVSQHC